MRDEFQELGSLRYLNESQQIIGYRDKVFILIKYVV